MNSRILVGTDLVRISRIQRMVEKGGQWLLQTVWTDAEIDYCGGRFDRLATRWAAKEATVKALGRGFGQIDPTHVEVLSEGGHGPAIKLCKSAHRRATELTVTSCSVSLSHDGDLAVAYVAMLTKDSHGGY